MSKHLLKLEFRCSLGGQEHYPGRTVVPLSTYRKVTVPEVRPDQELAGLWSGVYGPHGREILLVTYTDDDRITATKMLGKCLGHLLLPFPDSEVVAFLWKECPFLVS
jgi:hypothetical protein